MVEKLYHIIMPLWRRFRNSSYGRGKIWETDGKQEEEESQEMTG